MLVLLLTYMMTDIKYTVNCVSSNENQNNKYAITIIWYSD